MTSTVTKIGRCATCSGLSYDTPRTAAPPTHAPHLASCATTQATYTVTGTGSSMALVSAADAAPMNADTDTATAPLPTAPRTSPAIRLRRRRTVCTRTARRGGTAMHCCLT